MSYLASNAAAYDLATRRLAARDRLSIPRTIRVPEELDVATAIVWTINVQALGMPEASDECDEPADYSAAFHTFNPYI